MVDGFLSGELSVPSHLAKLLSLDLEQRETYLAGVDPQIATEIRELLAFETSSLDLSQAGAVAVAQQLLARDAPTWLGRWRVMERIGAGGMGTVFLVEHEELGVVRRAAAKLGWTPTSDTPFLSAIRREADALSRLQHPNIAMLLDFGVTDMGEPFIVSEYVEGRQLIAFANENELDLQQRWSLFLQLLDGVAAAHAALVLHLDIKPDNVLVTQDGAVKLIDFGLSSLPQPDLKEAAAAYLPHGWTKTYASPEQLNNEPVTVHSDVYSLGLVFQELCDGFKAPDQAGYQAVVYCATNAAPGQRYSSTAGFARDVRALCERRSVQLLANKPAYRWSRYLRRQWLPVSLGIAAVLTLVVSLFGVHHQYRLTVVERNRAIALLESEKATSDFVTQSLRQASVFGGGDAEMTVAQMLDHMLEQLPSAEKMSDRSKAWLASDLAAVLTGLGRYPEALDASQLAVKHAQASDELEDDIAHWTQYALTAGQAHHYDVALDAAEQALSIAEPIDHWRLPWTYLSQMQTLVKMKRWQDVVDMWPVIAALKTDRESVRGNIDYMRGVARIFLGDHTGARSDLDQAAEVYLRLYGAESVPFADVEFRRYQSFLYAGELAKAKRAIRQLNTTFARAYGERHFRNQVLQGELARLAYYDQSAGGNIQLLEETISALADQQNPPLTGNLRHLQGRMLLQEQQYGRALHVLEAAASELALLGRSHPDFVSTQVTQIEALLVNRNVQSAAALAQSIAAEQALSVGETHYRWQRAQWYLAQIAVEPNECPSSQATLQAQKLPVPDPFPAAFCDNSEIR